MHGMGLLHSRPERLDEARPPLAQALQLAQTDRERAAVWQLMARLEGRQGRTDAALQAADEAEAAIGAHPAIDRARGEALAKVCRCRGAAGRCPTSMIMSQGVPLQLSTVPSGMVSAKGAPAPLLTG